MSVKIELTFASADEAIAFLSKGTGAAVVTADKPAKTDPKSKAEKTADAPAQTPAADTKPSADTAPTAVPYEKSGLPEKIAACVKSDRAGVVALLKEFGAAKGSELKPEQFAAFGEKIDALLAAAASLA